MTHISAHRKLTLKAGECEKKPYSICMYTFSWRKKKRDFKCLILSQEGCWGGSSHYQQAPFTELVVSSKLIRFKLRFNFNQLRLSKKVSMILFLKILCIYVGDLFTALIIQTCQWGKKVNMFLTVCSCVQEIHCSLLFVAVIVAVGGLDQFQRLLSTLVTQTQ